MARPGNRPAGRVRTGGEWNGRCVASLGDPEAVRELYRAYGRAVFVIALRALGDRVLAEDAVQQTFLQAWRAAERFDPSRDPGPWLYAIARRGGGGRIPAGTAPPSGDHEKRSPRSRRCHHHSRRPGKPGRCAAPSTSYPKTSAPWFGPPTSRGSPTRRPPIDLGCRWVP